jgi:hypothetical protein
MSNMGEMAATIEELHKSAAAIHAAADWLTEQLCSKETQPEASTPDEPALTLEAVRAVLAEKSCAGHTAQIRSLLRKYGAGRLSGVDPGNYKALLADAEGLTDAT